MQNPYMAPGAAPYAAAPGYGLPTPPGPVRRDVSAVDAVRFPFREPNTLANVLFGLLLQIIPIVGPIALAGWLCEIHRRLVWQHPNPLPKFSFDDFGTYLKRGVVPFVGQLVLSLVLTFPAVLVAFGATFGLAATGSTGSTNPDVAMMVAVACAAVMLPFLVTMMVFGNSVTTLAELTEDFAAMLSPGRNWDYVRATWLKAIVAGLTLAVLAIGIALGGLLLCIVGIYAAIQVVHFASVHLRWQIYNHYLLSGGPPLAVKSLEPLASEQRGAVFPPAPPLGYPQPPPGGGGF